MFHRLASLQVEKLEKRLDKIELQVTNKLDAITKSIEQLAKNAGTFQRTHLPMKTNARRLGVKCAQPY